MNLSISARLSSATAAFSIGLLGLHLTAGSALAGEDAGKEARVARGKYLVTVAGCNDCHTPWKMGEAGPAPDMSRMLSGHPANFEVTAPAKTPEGPWNMVAAPTNTAWSGPWGVSFTANLTPDKETGLGKWTEGTFIQTIRTGRHMGRGRPILPPMPFPMYKHFTDEDLKAIFSYLQSIPAIENRVPEPLPAAAAKEQ
jgi:mono/diheme cytochrome c family protein